MITMLRVPLSWLVDWQGWWLSCYVWYRDWMGWHHGLFARRCTVPNATLACSVLCVEWRETDCKPMRHRQLGRCSRWERGRNRRSSVAPRPRRPAACQSVTSISNPPSPPPSPSPSPPPPPPSSSSRASSMAVRRRNGRDERIRAMCSNSVSRLLFNRRLNLQVGYHVPRAIIITQLHINVITSPPAHSYIGSVHAKYCQQWASWACIAGNFWLQNIQHCPTF